MISEQLSVQEMERARKLASPAPGVFVMVPLELLPAYLRLYGLSPAGFVEPNTLKVSRERVAGSG